VLRTFALSPSLAEAARAWPGGDAVQPRAASTVLLLRDPDDGHGDGGPQVFVLRRTATMAFAPRMHVFPGGGVDARDADPRVPWVGPDPRWWAAALGAGEAEASELVCAAVRELFEECGVMLAGPDAASVVPDLGDPQWEADRQALLDRSLALTELLGRRELVLRGDLLRPWSHWITPEIEPRRYDTRFFVAALPAGQRARHVGGEADEAAWIGARAAVRGHREGRLAMLPPTLVALEEVAAHDDVASVLAAPRRVRRVMPWLDGDAMRVDLDGVGGGEVGPS